MANNVTDSDHDIDIAEGECRDAANAANIKLASSMTKRLDATWLAGTGSGGLTLSLTAPANNTWYHVFVILVSGSADIGFDTSVTATNLIADHLATAYRRIGSVLTDGSANIIAFLQRGETFLWRTVVAEINATNPGSSAVTPTVTVPTGVVVEAEMNFRITDSSPSSQTRFLVTSPDVADTAPDGANFSTMMETTAGFGTANLRVKTNTSAQIRYRIENSNADINVLATLIGWTDRRGMDD